MISKGLLCQFGLNRAIGAEDADKELNKPGHLEKLGEGHQNLIIFKVL